MSLLKKYLDEHSGKSIAFVGAGVAHRDLIMLFAEYGADVTLCDKKSAEELGEQYEKFSALGVKFSLGANYLDALTHADVIFRTPGMMPSVPELRQAADRGAIITSEMETFFDLCPAKIYAITGSDGKTTTTSLIADMFTRVGSKVHLGGNIGVPLLPIIDDVRETDKVVVELSSFQLISMRKSPHVAVVTNITPNHLDKHSDMREYVEAKTNILRFQGEDDIAVLGFDNDRSRLLSGIVKGELRYFSMREDNIDGAYLKNEVLFVRTKGVSRAVCHADEVLLLGRHNIENSLAAFAAVASDIPPEIMEESAKNFKGVEHRIEYVRTVDEVKYYNHSIASSPLRMISGLKTLGKNLVVICGGADKKLDYSEAATCLIEHARVVILMGDTGVTIKSELQKIMTDENRLPIYNADTMEDAVALAREHARAGETVTLCPASTSFDKYNNFEERGNHYKRVVNSL